MAQATKTHLWRRYEPSARCPWNLSRAAHLWRRAGFGASWPQLQQSVKAGPQKTVDMLLRPKGDISGFNAECDSFTQSVASPAALRPWWLRRMILTPDPLREKMTLFWHDFFAADGASGAGGAQMRDHIAALRAKALGRFGELLGKIAGDTATVLSMGSTANGKTTPDEAFASQFLRRYTVGAGNFSQEDVRQTARAMTGWSVLRNKMRYFAEQHDGGKKTLLGRTGAFDSDDVVRIASRHPATARNLVQRLYRLFISETGQPEEALIAPLIESLAKDFDISKLVETMLRSSLFFSDAVMGQRIKSPVEFAVGIIRGLEANVSTVRLADDLAALGQNLCYPPTPDGWAHGRHWINQATVAGRDNLAAALLAGSGPYGGKCDPAALAKRHARADDKSAASMLASVLCAPGGVAPEPWKLLPPTGTPADRLRKTAYRLIARPEFQLA
jgi:uncharacterized protein (DUF1800 family)